MTLSTQPSSVIVKPGDTLVQHDALTAEVKKLRLFAQGKLGNSNQKGMLIWGPTGSGKTTLISTAFPFIGQQIKDMKAGIEPVIFTKDATGNDKAPVLMVAAPENGTTKQFYANILRRIDIGVHPRGNQQEQREQVKGYLADLETKLLIIEETQQITRSSAYELADVFKGAIDNFPCRTVLCGLTEISRLLEDNDQLDYRIVDPIVLEPFDWFNLDQRKAFKKILRTVQTEHETLFCHLDLTASPTVECLNIISGGLLGSLTSFLSLAVDVAAMAGRPYVLLEDLETLAATRKKARPALSDPFKDVLPSVWKPAPMQSGSNKTRRSA